MVTINVRIECTELILRLQRGERKLVFAIENAINNTAKRIQQAEFEHIGRKFTIRKPAFFYGSLERPGGAAAKLWKARAKQNRLFAELAVEAPDPRGRISGRLLLPIFERGGTRTPSHPTAKHVAVPITGGPARPTFENSIQPGFTWSRLRFVGFKDGKKVKRENSRKSRQDLTVFGTAGRPDVPFDNTGVQWKGAQRTFIAVNEEGVGGVIQRIGRKRKDTRFVYLFQKPMKLAQRMHWVQTAKRVARQWFGEEMRREASKALAKDGGRGL